MSTPVFPLLPEQRRPMRMPEIMAAMAAMAMAGALREDATLEMTPEQRELIRQRRAEGELQRQREREAYLAEKQQYNDALAAPYREARLKRNQAKMEAMERARLKQATSSQG